MFPPKNSLLFFLLFSICAPACYAERADRDKPMHLEADQVVVDDARQISTFIGNVQLSQGTMLIRGDKIVVSQDKDGFKLGIAYGHTASFRQKREGLDEYVDGYGNRIEYDTRAETVNFYEQARIKRDQDDVRGEHITYNAKTEIFSVNSNGAAQVDKTSSRVRAVLQPKPKQAVTPPSAPDALEIKPSESFSPAQ
ncbi:MAG TPA: lipopolysaccharide transport periplasmic protein LptA [Gallionella sp.]|nr:lipopolysaccharide transport periplasmic protein LptA [Gallionella sp.]